MIRSVNPATGEQVAEYPIHDEAAVDGFITTAHRRFADWRRRSFGERGEVLVRVAAELEKREDELARLMAVEMGKPVTGGIAEVRKCAWVCRHYAEHAESYLADQPIDADRTRSYVHHEPIGVVLGVMPWNFPLWQVYRYTAPALMAGNVTVLKHASNVTGCALAIEEMFAAAGLPDGVFTTLVVPSSRVAGILEHPLVRAATLTGSGPAGAAVAAKAGSLLKKTVLELGGSDPYLILEDADLESAAASCAQSRLLNSGQSCICAKRFLVVDAVHDRFVDLFAAQMAAAVMGDPLDPATEVGPLARVDLRDDLHGQVAATIEAGAGVRMGGEVPDGPGAFYPPTILTGVKPGMPAYHEELFGPAAAVIRVADAEEAIAVANDTVFGLGAAVFTADVARGERIAAERLEAGACFVNGMVASDPRLPFGGIKESGFGRELADLGIKEFVNAKTVVIA